MLTNRRFSLNGITISMAISDVNLHVGEADSRAEILMWGGPNKIRPGEMDPSWVGSPVMAGLIFDLAVICLKASMSIDALDNKLSRYDYMGRKR